MFHCISGQVRRLSVWEVGSSSPLRVSTHWLPFHVRLFEFSFGSFGALSVLKGYLWTFWIARQLGKIETIQFGGNLPNLKASRPFEDKSQKLHVLINITCFHLAKGQELAIDGHGAIFDVWRWLCSTLPGYVIVPLCLQAKPYHSVPENWNMHPVRNVWPRTSCPGTTG